jgi:hypothetical protein
MRLRRLGAYGRGRSWAASRRRAVPFAHLRCPSRLTLRSAGNSGGVGLAWDIVELAWDSRDC